MKPLHELDKFLIGLRKHAEGNPESIVLSISRLPVPNWDLSPYRRWCRGKVVTYSVEIAEPGDPVAEMLQADEEKNGWQHMLRESFRLAVAEQRRGELE